MLSAVLRSDIAIQVSIQIMNAFVVMRNQVVTNEILLQRLDKVEKKQIETDQKFEKVFNALQNKELQAEKGVFFEGQVFDAYHFVAEIIRRAEKSILLIDNYIDDSVLTLLSKRKAKVEATIYTKNITKQLKLDIQKYNAQYAPISIKLI